MAIRVRLTIIVYGDGREQTFSVRAPKSPSRLGRTRNS